MAKKKGASKEKSPKTAAAPSGRKKEIGVKDYSDLFGAEQADGGFGSGQADDGKPAYAEEEKTDAGADESTIANVVSEPMEGKKGKGASGKKAKAGKKGRQQLPLEETEVKIEIPGEEEGDGAEEGEAPQASQAAGSGMGMEAEGKGAGKAAGGGFGMEAPDGGAEKDADTAEPEAVHEETGEKASVNAPAQFVRVQSSLSSVDSEKVLEAALFMASQPLALSDLAKLVGIAAIGHVDEKLAKLAAKYGGDASAIEIVKEEHGKWSMRVKAAYAPSVRTFAGEAEISRHALKTLAYISRSDGIKKRDLYKKLGSTIYGDVAELIEKGFITATPSGRTVSLKTTAKFTQYFQG